MLMRDSPTEHSELDGPMDSHYSPRFFILFFWVDHASADEM
jgi:hypothetical protein